MSNLEVTPELASSFDETFDRYRYLERIAIANTVNPCFVLSVLDTRDRIAYCRESGISDVKAQRIIAKYPGEELDNDFNRFHDGEIAEEKFSQDMRDIIGIVNGYAADYIDSAGEVWLKSLNPDGTVQARIPELVDFGRMNPFEYNYFDKDNQPYMYIRFGTYDEGVETDFEVEKFEFTDRGYNIQTMLVENADMQAVDEAVAKLHAALFRITGAEEALNNDANLR